MHLAGFDIADDELELAAIRAGGPGGQNVNKVSSAIHLRFDIRASASLPEPVKLRLLRLHDQRITRDGVVVIKSQRHRSQELNRAEALQRLAELLEAARRVPKPRVATRPTLASVRRRVQDKKLKSRLKSLRGKPTGDA